MQAGGEADLPMITRYFCSTVRGDVSDDEKRHRMLNRFELSLSLSFLQETVQIMRNSLSSASVVISRAKLIICHAILSCGLSLQNSISESAAWLLRARLAAWKVGRRQHLQLG